MCGILIEYRIFLPEIYWRGILGKNERPNRPSHKEGRDWEDFGDVTINLPYQFLEPNEAFITGDFTKDMLHFIKEHKLGKVLNETGRSGYATYQKVAFDLARLAEFDPEGVAEHCRFAGIEVPKEKPQKTKKQNRGEER